MSINFEFNFIAMSQIRQTKLTLSNIHKVSCTQKYNQLPKSYLFFFPTQYLASNKQQQYITTSKLKQPIFPTLHHKGYKIVYIYNIQTNLNQVTQPPNYYKQQYNLYYYLQLIVIRQLLTRQGRTIFIVLSKITSSNGDSINSTLTPEPSDGTTITSDTFLYPFLLAFIIYSPGAKGREKSPN
eukprot:TRINITY_DN17554_c0_g1_i1.p1 TRINITY_DN17554_c0_g1~~TRINITY_DN17554_c0_g1_i1.p1  ORF type:complete len:199 (-),score=-18.87 TRINITY_DN17554_c0_g1_i1:104-652(-)